jgi:hypothetical protein
MPPAETMTCSGEALMLLCRATLLLIAFLSGVMPALGT